MSGHSKWSTIKRKKGALDAKRGKIFSRLAKQITVAARQNKNLDVAIGAAKAANMPRENIERAIKRGTGEGADVVKIEEITYEAYGPGGSAILITVLTDNKNRTMGDLRAIANKLEFNLVQAGSVMYLFDQKGVLEVEAGADVESDQLTLIDAGAEEIDDEKDRLVGYTPANKLGSAKQLIDNSDLKIIDAKLAYIPKNFLEISPTDQMSLIKILEALEELEDVDSIETNAYLSVDTG